jgi:hypothetical protein
MGIIADIYKIFIGAGRPLGTKLEQALALSLLPSRMISRGEYNIISGSPFLANIVDANTNSRKVKENGRIRIIPIACLTNYGERLLHRDFGQIGLRELKEVMDQAERYRDQAQSYDKPQR